jgi:zinc/manganese transport system permease protein
MFAHAFVRNAYLAGTFIALACGAVGWFVVLRGQLFAGDAFGHVAWVGAIAAAVIGFDERVGLFALTIAVAAGMAALGRRGEADDTVIGMAFAWILGIGILLAVVLATSAAGGNGTFTTNTLFGSIYALSAGGSVLAARIALAVAIVLVLVVRPMLFTTLDPELAAVRGIPVRALGVGFLVILAVVTAESVQAVGALLLLGLLAAPAGAAHQLTARPYREVAISAAIAVGATWAGLALSYSIPSLLRARQSSAWPQPPTLPRRSSREPAGEDRQRLRVGVTTRAAAASSRCGSNIPQATRRTFVAYPRAYVRRRQVSVNGVLRGPQRLGRA